MRDLHSSDQYSQTSFPPLVASGHGFTLMELLLAVLLLGIVSTMIYSVLNVGVRFTDRGEERILLLDREQGFLNLLHDQVRSAIYDKQRKEPGITADGDILRVLTRRPLAHDYAGPVLAVYRYDASDRTIYYTEKKDYYNIDYQGDYFPDFDEMHRLIQSTDSGVGFSYDEDTYELTLEYQDKQYIFTPKCGELRQIPE